MADLSITRETSRAIGSERSSALAFAVCCIVMLTMLLTPAIWNGFPIVFPDTGGYLARAFEGTLALGRSAVYGLILAAAIPLEFWPIVILQAALCLWLILLILRAHGLGGHPGTALAVVLGLCILTSVSWFSSQLMPDVLFPIAVLALYLLAFHWGALRSFERLGLMLTIALAVASHMAALALCLGLLSSLLILRRWKALRSARLPAPSVALVAGVALLLATNLGASGRFAFTPGGESFLFGRLLQDGFVDRYLREHCPDPSVQLCRYAGSLPDTADNWLWLAESPFRKLGGAIGYGNEERRIIIRSLIEHPIDHLVAVLQDMAEQFASFRTEIVTDRGAMWHAEWTIETRAPDAAADYHAARQQQGFTDPVSGDWRSVLDLAPLNAIHLPFAWIGIAGLLGITISGRRLGLAPADTAFATTVLLALAINAGVCATFANTVDRYQSRLVWLAPFALAVILLRRRYSRA
ncbi:MAG TPA: hypothetical protein VFB45_09475 [Pseudolabrys sp.]|nr:hypothetical protein [Pseudolabrys sp.]